MEESKQVAYRAYSESAPESTTRVTRRGNRSKRKTGNKAIHKANRTTTRVSITAVVLRIRAVVVTYPALDGHRHGSVVVRKHVRKQVGALDMANNRRAVSPAAVVAADTAEESNERW